MSVVVLSDGRAVDGNMSTLLKLQHRILLKLSKDLARNSSSTCGADSSAQKAIADANMLGLEVVDRLEEL